MFIAVSDFGFPPPPPKKKKPIWNLTLPVQFSPPYPGKVKFVGREGLIRQTPHSPGTENSQMPGVCPGGGGGGCWSFDLIIRTVPPITEMFWPVYHNLVGWINATISYNCFLVLPISPWVSEDSSSPGSSRYSKWRSRWSRFKQPRRAGFWDPFLVINTKTNQMLPKDSTFDFD